MFIAKTLARVGDYEKRARLALIAGEGLSHRGITGALCARAIGVGQAIAILLEKV